MREDGTPVDLMREDGTPVDLLKVDRRRGHISLVVNGVAEGAFVDLGSVLHWWSHISLQLTPEQAGELGRALTAWADRKKEPTGRDVEPTDYTACGEPLVAANLGIHGGTARVPVYCDLPVHHDGLHFAGVEFTGAPESKVAQGSLDARAALRGDA